VLTEEEITRQFDAAISELYVVFARYPLRREIDHCEHCVFPEDDALIRSKPLRQLAGTDLSKYAFKAMTTWGDEEDLKHFLPRLLELWTEDDFMLLTDDQLIRKMRMAGWGAWPDDEEAAIKSFLIAWWPQILVSAPREELIRILIPLLYETFGDLGPFLKQWRELASTSEPAMEALIGYISYLLIRAPRKYGTEEDERIRATVEEWLASTSIRKTLEDAFFHFSAQRLTTQISEALQTIDACFPATRENGESDGRDA